MSNRPNRQQRRAMERKQEAYATIQKLTEKAVKPKRARKLSLLAAVGVAGIVLAICGGAYLTLSGAQSGSSVVRHLPSK